MMAQRIRAQICGRLIFSTLEIWYARPCWSICSLFEFRSAGTKLDDGTVLGDLDGDGEPDFGGAKTILKCKISLGGVISGVLAGAEPSLDAVSPNAGGGSLTGRGRAFHSARCTDAVVMPMIGPLVVGCLGTNKHQVVLSGDDTGKDCLGIAGEPMEAGVMRLGFIANDTARDQRIMFAEAKSVRVGDRVVLENLANGERKEGRVNTRGYFRLAVADALDPIARRPILGLKMMSQVLSLSLIQRSWAIIYD